MAKKYLTSERLFREAKKYIPGGVNSPVRAFKAVGASPLFIKKAKGAYVYDEDGNKYIDYVSSWGPMILGHADDDVIKAASGALKDGTSFGAPTRKELRLARLVLGIYPSIEKLRLTSSGTEAAMSAIRLARGWTGKEKIIKFEGCYHGHFDSLLVKAGSGAATFGVPTSLGVSKSLARDTITLPFNDTEAVKRAIRTNKRKIACVIVEPVPANMGVILPKAGFLEGLRRITKENGILLIFDEVITGFRAALGGAQEVFGIRPDLTVLGKIIGGGFPIGAFGGRGDIMGLLAPEGGVYQAGTLSGNPIAVAAGIATIKKLSQKDTYKKLDEKGAKLQAGYAEAAQKASVNVKINRFGSMLTLFFTERRDVEDYAGAKACDTKRFALFFRGMLKQGVYLAPSQFEANFLSVKHGLPEIESTLAAAGKVLAGI